MARWISKLGIWVNADSTSLKKFATTARGAAGALRSISHALDLTNLASTKSFQLNKSLTETAAQMGAQTSTLSDQVIDLSNATGLSTEKTSALVQALASAGQEIDNIDPRLAELTGRFGVSAQGAVELVAATRNLGTTVTDLTDATASWQVQFKMPGMLAQLPEVVGYARKSMAEFGTTVAGDTKSILENTLKTGAIYAKTFGVDIPQAIQMAQQSESKFASTLSNSRRVALGLSKDYDALTMSLMETGQYGFQEIQDMLKNGQKDPLTFAKNIKEMEDRLRAAGEAGDRMANRLHEQMLMNAPEVVKELLTSEGALTEALKKRAEANRIAETDVGKGGSAFNNMTASLKDTAGTTIETFKNLLSLGKTIIGLAVADDVNSMFKGLNDTLRDINTRIKEFAETASTSETVQKLRPIFHAVGKALIVIGTAAGAAASAFVPFLNFGGSVARVMSFLTRGAKGAAATTGKVASETGILSGVLRRFTKFLFGPVNAFKSIMVALNDFGKSLRDPKLSGAQVFARGLRAVFVGLASFIDTIFLGIPSFLMKTFFPEMGGSLEQGVKILMGRFERWLTQGGSTSIGEFAESVLGKLNTALSHVRDYVFAHLAGWRKHVASFGRNIGRAIGFIGKLAIGHIKKQFSIDTWRGIWNSVLNFFKGEGTSTFGDTMLDLGKAAVDLLGDFFSNAADEILRAFGTNIDAVTEMFHAFGDALTDWWDRKTTELTTPVHIAFETMGILVDKAMLGLKTGISIAWDAIKESVASVVGWIIENAIGPLMKKMADAQLMVAKAKYALGGSDEELIKAQEAYDATAGSIEGYTKKLSESAKETINQSNLRTRADEDALAKRQAMLETYKKNEDKIQADADKGYQARKETREKAAADRYSKMMETVAAKDKARAEEAAKFEQAKTQLEGSRKSAGAYLASVADALAKKQKDATDQGDANAAKALGKKLAKTQDLIQALEDATSQKGVNKVVVKTKLLAGEKVDAAELKAAGLKTKTQSKGDGPAPMSAALGAGSVKPPTPPKVEAPKPAPSQSVTVKNVVEFKGDLGKVVERTQAEEMLSTGGGIGGRP